MSWTRSLRVNFHEGRGFLWVGSVFIGAWYNTTDAGLTPAQRSTQIALAVALVPVAGVLEGSSGLWAVSDWLRGRRKLYGTPRPRRKPLTRPSSTRPRRRSQVLTRTVSGGRSGAPDEAAVGAGDAFAAVTPALCPSGLRPGRAEYCGWWVPWARRPSSVSSTSAFPYWCSPTAWSTDRLLPPWSLPWFSPLPWAGS